METFYFAGVDPAPSEGARSADGAIVILRAQPNERWEGWNRVGRGKTGGTPVPLRRRGEAPVPLPEQAVDWDRDYVYAKRLRKLSARQWAGAITRLHLRFGLTGIMLDPGGGGMWIKREMASRRQLIDGIETEVTPIVSRDETTVAQGHFILSLFKRGDPAIEVLWPELAGDDLLVDAMFAHFKEELDAAAYGFPRPYPEWTRDEMAGWTEERVWALRNLSAMMKQLQNIDVLTNENGQFIFTKRNARQFAFRGLKDFAMAGMYADVGFLAWLRQGSQDWAVGPGDRVLFGGWR